ncbi:carbon-nitrogen hydrolase family protein [Raineyella sp. LH-20]|uniref:carbon-nitrogen hydrolase family protein n=1 Tax=Raineyella sp. LH-20 TaxID=3081204 RepID=UPI002952BA1C|nr:carbon-nitrogen hydrolase family protein [Raineyella sp. LH-20]WOP18412.1 carbon-nitrogen hydrolase family protein [Raineyella sp. LH-20]
MRIALAQVSSGPDPVDNLATIGEWTARAADENADLVVFPEAMMKAFGRGLRDVAEPVDGPWARAVADHADRHDLVAMAGMFTPEDPDRPEGRGSGTSTPRIRNTLLVTGRGIHDGYDKLHLFDAFGFQESRTVAPGIDPCLVSVPARVGGGALVGLSICYDVRFPALFKALAEAGATVQVVAACWQDGPGKLEQWRLTCRARAADSTSWVLACGQPVPEGTAPGTATGAPRGVGHSMVVDPTGTVVAELGAGPDLLIVDLDPEEATRTRVALPVLANRVTELEPVRRLA